MIQLGDDPGFTQQTFLHVGTGNLVPADALEGDLPPEALILGEIDFPHSSRAQFP